MSRLVIEGLQPVCGGPFSFSVDAGECAVLSGPSGCGKTLLLRALADLDPAEGDVLLDNVSRNAVAAPVWRKQVGWLPAEASWWFDHVGEHFVRDQGAGIRSQELPSIGKKQQAATQLLPSIGKEQQGAMHLQRDAQAVTPAKVTSALGNLGFETDVFEWRVDRLSTGEKQRLGLFRLLLNEPKVLLLDEPTAALDVSNVRNVEEVIAAYRERTGAAVVWISHSVEQIERVADRHLKLWEAS